MAFSLSVRTLSKMSSSVIGQKTCETYQVSRNPICCNRQILVFDWQFFHIWELARGQGFFVALFCFVVAVNEADLVRVRKVNTVDVK